ncbi:MAG: dipeptidase [Rhodospirillaceae bacterium]
MPASAQDAVLLARAKALHAKIITIDTHVDIPLDFSTGAYDMMKPGPRGQQVHLPTMISGGYDAPFFIVYVGQGERNTAGYAQALGDAFTKFGAIHKLAEQLYPDKIGLALTAADARRIHASGRKVAFIGLENGYPMGKDLRLLDQFYDFGARYFGPTHNGHNDLGDSAQPRRDEPAAEWNGLSPLGKQVVKRLNELGIMVDVSHSSAKATMDMISLSATPVIASHSGVKGVMDHPRNLTDEALDAIKRTGGVVQIVAFDGYLRAVPPEKTAAIAAVRKEMGIQPGEFSKMSPEAERAYDAKLAEIDKKWPKANLEDLGDHIDYAVKRMGVDHVGVSSDFNGGGGIDGFNSSGEAINVTMELLKRGYTDDQIGKIWGGNLLRVMEKAEQYAANFKKSAK